jgi:hypothetical protein
MVGAMLSLAAFGRLYLGMSSNPRIPQYVGSKSFFDGLWSSSSTLLSSRKQLIEISTFPRLAYFGSYAKDTVEGGRERDW